ncbi:MAG: FAD-binding oxidoreductase [bacterium]
MNRERRYLWRRTFARIIEELIDFVVKVGGQVTAEHGIGWLRRKFLKKGLTEAEIGVMERLKKVRDPEGILNPGKIFP